MNYGFDYFYTRDSLKIRCGQFQPAGIDPCGTIVYLPGRTEFIEKNTEAFKALCRRGYKLYTLDLRGQGLSERMLADRHKGWVRSYGDFLSDLALFMERIVWPGAISPVIVMGHSMGGHIALRFIRENPGIIEKAVLISPMFGINTFPFPRRLVKKIARAAVRAGLGDRYIAGAGKYRLKSKRFLFNPLTNDPERFMHEIREIRKNPDLALGGVTYGWLAASFDSIDTIHVPGYVEKITIPTLLVSGTRDRVVSRFAQKRICRRMRNCRFFEIKGAKHDILKETDVFQEQFWKAFDSFAAG